MFFNFLFFLLPDAANNKELEEKGKTKCQHNRFGFYLKYLNKEYGDLNVKAVRTATGLILRVAVQMSHAKTKKKKKNSLTLLVTCITSKN